ncbi:MAG: 1-acyl-sn-glycerol-3-phosphate acyltransferase, partial [Candidatus Aminicenantes bacterium]|nr:1-acyl-sn-glycerol-3-phosphate acyltransferase [Candidatus Aminicenantes bacterium]
KQILADKILKKLLFNLYYGAAFTFVTLAGLLLLPWILLVNVFFLGRSVDSALRRAIRFYGWVLVCVVPFMAPVTVENKGEKFHFPAILVANHNSGIDPYLFGAVPIENCFLTSWPFNIPVYGRIMRLAGYIDSKKGWDEIREKGAELLDSGSSLTIWPEGHRSRDGRLGRFKKGAFVLAVETGYPVVPVSILGSGEILSPGKRFLSPGKVKLILHNPVYPDTHGDKEQSITALRDTVRQIIEKTLQENLHFSSAPDILRDNPKTSVSDVQGRQHGSI